MYNQAFSQVVFRELLSQDHVGKIENSINLDGKTMHYEWQFVDMQLGSYFTEEEAIEKIFYTLNLKDDSVPLKKFDVLLRDLIVTFYIEIKIKKGEDERTITAIYNKTNKWVKLKANLHDGCDQEPLWKRLDGVTSFEQLLNHVVREVDKNVNLSCY
jgi:hypothetical protein